MRFQVPRFKERVPGKRFNRADVIKWVGCRLKAEWKKMYKYISNLSQSAVGCCRMLSPCIDFWLQGRR